MNYVERDGIWHIVTRAEDAEAITMCELRIVQQAHLWEREPSPLCSRCKAVERAARTAPRSTIPLGRRR